VRAKRKGIDLRKTWRHVGQDWVPPGRLRAGCQPALGGPFCKRSNGGLSTRRGLTVGPLSAPAVSPDGQYVVYNGGGGLRIMRVADGGDLFGGKSFEIGGGTPRWMPDGKALAFIQTDVNGVRGIFVQDFVPGQDTTKTRRPLAGFDPEMFAETLNISPDGSHIVVSYREQAANVMLAEHVPGVSPPPQKAR
jgi:dipeptidyl aminopeptidase/acylaminoacyl peptidase